jgi:uncharacterized protein (TIGR02268 family)
VFASTTLSLLTLMILAEEPASPRMPFELRCESEALRIETSVAVSGELLRVCIRPALPTTLQFDSRPFRGVVEVEGRERLTDLSIGEHSITVLPRGDLSPGERIQFGIHFVEETTPTRIDLELVVHPTRSARLMEVHRSQTHEDKQELAHDERGLGGITALLAAGLLFLKDQSLLARTVENVKTNSDSIHLEVKRVYAYRAMAVEDLQRMKARIAFALLLRNKDPQPWRAQDASLESVAGEPIAVQTLWQSTRAPLGAGEEAWLVVETEIEAWDTQGPFTLDLVDASGTRHVRLGTLTLPQ